MLWIHSDRPLTLKRLIKAWQALGEESDRAQHAAGGNRREWAARMVEQAMPYRTQETDSFWEEEVEALYALCELLDRNTSIALTPLVVPTTITPPCAALLRGWKVGKWLDTDEPFSPLALIWLKEWGAKTDQVMAGTVIKTAETDGLAILVCQREGEVPVVREQRDHTVEHIDEAMYLLQANLDDASPEWMSHTLKMLFTVGANDVSFLPLTMKKGRPGTMVQVMCYASQLDVMKEMLFRETTTFGIRYFPVACHRLARRFCRVPTRWGEVSVKLGYLQGERVQVAPEYDDCAKLAEQADVPLKQVYQEALSLALACAPLRLPGAGDKRG